MKKSFKTIILNNFVLKAGEKFKKRARIEMKISTDFLRLLKYFSDNQNFTSLF